MVRLNILLLGSFMFISGCVSLAPDYQRPAAPIPTAFSMGADQSEKNIDTEIHIPSWQQFFINAELKEIISQSLINNRDLQLAILNVEEARQLYRVTQSDRLPQATLSSSAEYSRGLKTGSSLDRNYRIGPDISFEIDFFGRLKNLSAADRARFLAANETQRTTHILTIKTVAEAFLNYQLNIQQLAIAQKTQLNYQYNEKLVKQRVISGLANIVELEQARGQTENIQADIAKFNGEIARSRHALQLLTGDYDINVLSTEAAANLVLLPEELSSNILLQRPDILAAEQLLIAENANIGAARAAFFPSISFGLGLSASSDALGSVFDSASGVWNFLPKITMPIFSGGKNSANLSLAELRKQKSIINYEIAIQNAFKEVSDGLTQRESYRAQITAKINYINSLTITQQRAASLYSHGAISYLNVLDTERALFIEQQNLLTLQSQQQLNEITLFTALGGGLTEQ